MTSSEPTSPVSDPEDLVRPLYKIKGLICKSKFPVFLVRSRSPNKTPYAIKHFPRETKCANVAYISESRCQFLKHKNIVSIKKLFERQVNMHKGKKIVSSCIVMDYAPYGDFAQIIENNTDGLFEEKLVRAFFHDLVEGVEHMHNNGVTHMDLKLENLLMGNDLQLLIADFDCCHMEGDDKIRSRGTRNYRAPEMLSGQFDLDHIKAVDVFSMGVILFALMAHRMPYSEDQDFKGYQLYQLLLDDPDRFWVAQEILTEETEDFSKSLKVLIEGMTRRNPKHRLTIDQIKQSVWYRGSKYSSQEMQRLKYRTDEI